jgi:hypothetical protein
MEGLITKLPQPYHRQVMDIWEELASTFNITKARGTTPIPHFSWHVAESYSPGVLQPLSQLFDSQSTPLIKTTGFGIFHGEAPVVYIGIQTTSELLHLHQQLTEIIQPYAIGSHALYEPIHWTPHITLALHDTTPQIAGDIIARYSANPFKWEFYFDNLILLTETLQGAFIEKDQIRF